VYPKDDADEKDERKYNYIISFSPCRLLPVSFSLHHSDLALTEWFEDGFNFAQSTVHNSVFTGKQWCAKLDDG